MTFAELTEFIKKISKSKDTSFQESGLELQKLIFSLPKDKFLPILKEIGTIPENIDHDSSEEKLYSKCTDIVLAKTFQEIGMKSTVNKERANSADVFGKSEYHDYTYVGDAKAFRLSRTAKNQKDFKVKSMVDWKGDNDYAILVCPYYQYPKTNSQIYGQALDGNVCLLSWEHLVFFIEHNIVESTKMNLSRIWNFSDTLSESITIKDKNKNTNFYQDGNKIICSTIGKPLNDLIASLEKHKARIIQRGQGEIKFWEEKIQDIKKYSKEQAISELITSMKLNEKIEAIRSYIQSLS
ncbi:HindIII family type II restriction endonuclease [Leptospira jelokensis]|uniref:HindIII family type II restriction endonuclease n=1 Tax=Leptospira jelokensis TaxID=2484931 RepID=UPI0010912FA2|nr:HindIII family type II restriction endonuclease [Leptospira jelokensis]TGM03236.1 HindIII family type II restriction endonuclease [Leptospira jelokensis]